MPVRLRPGSVICLLCGPSLIVSIGGVPYSFGENWIKSHADACKAANKPCLLEECKTASPFDSSRSRHSHPTPSEIDPKEEMSDCSFQTAPALAAISRNTGSRQPFRSPLMA